MTYTTWYNCYISGQPTFGFSVNSEGIIENFNDRNVNGRKIKEFRPWFIKNKAEVVVVAKQIEK